MRNCPICDEFDYDLRPLWSMDYHIPDDWPLMSSIDWYVCGYCGLLFGDGDFDQHLLDEYYRMRYGYGIDGPENIDRLQKNALWIADRYPKDAVIVDFGGGQSILKRSLEKRGFTNVSCVEPGGHLPARCDLIFCSHVLEHIYDLPATMEALIDALKDDGLFVIDGPDATGLLLHWPMPMLDFNTKHIQHFRLIDYLNLGRHWGLELTECHPYEDVRPGWRAPAYQLHFRKCFNVALASRAHVIGNMSVLVKKLKEIKEPVNVWGLGDIAWHLLAQVEVPVLDYIDNDPAYRDATYKGQPVLERPTNDAPILIMAQGQRDRLIDAIRKAGITNEIIELKVE